MTLRVLVAPALAAALLVRTITTFAQCSSCAVTTR
jgi:hypothetical protein